MNAETVDLLRAAHAFLGAFASNCPPAFMRQLEHGTNPTIVIAYRDVPHLLVSVNVDGVPHTCEIPLVGSGMRN